MTLTAIVMLARAAGAAADAPSPIVTGTDYAAPDIRLFDGAGRQVTGFFAYDSPQVGGVAVGDVGGDPGPDVVVGAGSGGPPRVTVFDRQGSAERSFLAYAPGSTGGVFVALGNLNGVGRSEIVAGAAAGGSHVRVWDGESGAELASFFAFPGITVGGVSVAVGDVNGDGKAEIVAGGGVDAGPLVRVFDQKGAVQRTFAAFDSTRGGGVLVAAGDLDGDGRAEIVTGVRESDGPQLSVFDATGTPRWSASPFPSATTVAVAVADVTGDGKGEVLAAAPIDGLITIKAFDAKGNPLAIATGDPQWGERAVLGAGDLDGDGRADLVVVASNTYASDLRAVTPDGRVLTAFRPSDPLFTGGMRVAEGDVDGDGTPEVIAAPGYGRRAEVRVFDQQGNLLDAFDALDPVYRGGVYVAAGDVTGDGRAEIVVGASSGEPIVRVLDGRDGNILETFEAYETGFYGGVRVAVADLNGDGKGEIVTGAGYGGGPHVQVFDAKGGRVTSWFAFDETSEAGVWVAAGDVNGDGRDDVIVGSEGWPPQVKIFDGVLFGSVVLGSFGTPDVPGARVGAGDVDGDGNAEILVAGGWGGLVQVYRADGTRLASFRPYDGFDGGLFVASALRLRGPQLRNAPPSAPVVKGPRSTRSRHPLYRFSSTDPDGPNTQIRFRCSFDSYALHVCAARYSQRLGPGRHLLRVRAYDGDGGRSGVSVVRVIVR